MATALTADRFLAALRAEGVTVVEVGNWRTHNRNHRGPWGPVHGVIIHHTVTGRPTDPVDLCRSGYDRLPGPLCHGVITKDGRVHVIGYGRTNHAGGGDETVLQAVIDEDYRTRPPTPRKGNTDGVDGNRAFYGFECENLGDGRDPWTAAQLDAIERVSAAICRAHGWTARSVIGHLEWSDDKVDPRGISMPSMRDKVAARLGEKPTPPSRPSVSLARLQSAARQDPTKAGAPVSYPGVRIVENALEHEGLLDRTRVDGHFGTATRTAYSAWQRRRGHTGAAADGIPGIETLTALGTRHSFTVTD
ncbi:N-acetylmuramoyl-L-alanine amidase [Streptomyces sp. NPDC002073]